MLVARSASADEPSWATSQAIALTRQASTLVSQGEGAAAAKQLLDALAFDPTYGPAYVALGNIQESLGDLREAERIYSAGIEHVVGFAEGHSARAKLFRRMGRLVEATLDFDVALSLQPDDLALLEALCGTLVARGLLPAALATSRRAEVVASARGDAAAFTHAHTRSKALAVMIGDVDPVAAGTLGRGTLRTAIARHASRSLKK